MLLGFLLVYIVKNKYIRFILTVIFEFFSYLTAIFTKATHIDYAFISNIEKSIIKIMFTVFLKQVILMILFIILCNYLIIKLWKKYKDRLEKWNIKYIYLIFLILLGINFSKFGVANSIYKTADQTVFVSENTNIDENLRALGINPKDYVLKDDITAEPGKNVVIIYLESLEKNYLDNELFDNITPNLNKLKDEWTFYDYQDNSGWTMGGMYTTQTGLLPFFGLQGNEIFQNITKTNFPSIGSILKRAGYNQMFMNGASLLYAGKGNFFEQQGYKCYGNEEYDKKYPRNGWGLRDKDLFEEAKKKYIELSKKNKPFNLTLLTVDTHFPNGLPDERIESLIKTKERNMEYCVESNDYLIGGFIEFLKKQPNYENTAIYILPDHLIMGNEVGTPVTKKLNKKPRDLFLLTNQKNIPEYENINEKLYFYDIPKIILNGADIKTNAKYIKDLIPNISVKDFYEKSKEFQNLNLSLVEFNSLKNGIKVEKSETGEIDFKLGNKIVDNFYINEDKIKYYPLDDDLNIKGNFYINKDDYKHMLYYSNAEKILVFRMNDSYQIEMLISDYNKNIYFKEKYEKDKKIFSIGKYSLTKDEINMTYKKIKQIFKNIPVKEGLLKQENLNFYLEYLRKLENKNILIIVSVSDEASSLYHLYRENFKKLGSKVDFSNKYRWSYLGVFDTVGKKYLEEISEDRIDRNIKIDGIKMNLVSSGFDKGNLSLINIAGINYSKQGRGLNFVVLNKNTEEILDIFTVDTHKDIKLKIQR